eukprot:SAG22_NODE_850_length_6855_cov_13.560391_3_plen_1538_part_00
MPMRLVLAAAMFMLAVAAHRPAAESTQFANCERAGALLRELEALRLHRGARQEVAVEQSATGRNTTLRFQRPSVVGSSANTKFWFANLIKRAGNRTLLLAVSQAQDGFTCPPIKMTDGSQPQLGRLPDRLPGRLPLAALETATVCASTWRSTDGGSAWARVSPELEFDFGGDMGLPSLPGSPPSLISIMGQGSCHQPNDTTIVTCQIVTLDAQDLPASGLFPGPPAGSSYSMSGPMTITGLPRLKTNPSTGQLSGVTLESKVIVMPTTNTLLTSVSVSPVGGHCAGVTDECTMLVIIESTNRSASSWRVNGVVAPDLILPEKGDDAGAWHCNGGGSTACAAPDEHDIELLPDGQLLIAARIGVFTPLFVARSTDRGRSWVPYTRQRMWSVFPKLLRLSNGVVLLASGRPGIMLWSSDDGHGDTWVQHNLASVHNQLLPTDPPGYTTAFAAVDNFSSVHWPLLNLSSGGSLLPEDCNWPLNASTGPGCTQNWEASQSTAYHSLIEVEPNVALLTYDQLAFGWDFPPGPRHAVDTVYAMRIQVEVPKGDSEANTGGTKLKTDDIARRHFVAATVRGAGVTLKMDDFMDERSSVERNAVSTVHYVVMHHLDIGWVFPTAAQTVAMYLNESGWITYPMDGPINSKRGKRIPTGLIDRAMDVADELRQRAPEAPKQFVFTTWAQLVSLYLDCPPSMGFLCPGSRRRDRLRAAIRRGDVAYHAWPVNAEAEMHDVASLAGAIRSVQALDRSLGLPGNRSCLATQDAPGQSRGVVPVAAREGVRGLFLGANADSNAIEIPRGAPCSLSCDGKMDGNSCLFAFKWRDEASDEQLVALWHNGGHGAQGAPLYNGSIGIFHDSAHNLSHDALVIPGVGHAIAIRASGDVPPGWGPAGIYEVGSAGIQADHQILQRLFPRAKIVGSTFDAFLDVLHESPAGLQSLPVVTEEIGDTWVFGLASDPFKLAAVRAIGRERARYLAMGGDQRDPRYLNFSRLFAKAQGECWGGIDCADCRRPDPAWCTNTAWRERMNEPVYRGMVASWVEQRRWALDVPIQALGELPLADKMRAELSSLRQRNAVPALPRGMQVVPSERWASRIDCGDGVAIGFNASTGAIDSLSSGAVDFAGPNNPLAAFVYRTYSSEFLLQMSRGYFNEAGTGSAGTYFGTWCQGTETSQFVSRLQAMWSTSSNSGCEVLIKMDIPSRSPPSCPTDAVCAGPARNCSTCRAGRCITCLPGFSFVRGQDGCKGDCIARQDRGCTTPVEQSSNCSAYTDAHCATCKAPGSSRWPCAATDPTCCLTCPPGFRFTMGGTADCTGTCTAPSRRPVSATNAYGAPEEVWLRVARTAAGRPKFDLTVWLANKTATRRKESIALVFNPASVSPQSMRLNKIGTWIDPQAVIKNGSRHIHMLSEAGVRWSSHDSKAAKLTVRPLDSSLVSVGASHPLPVDVAQEPSNVSQGVAFQLFNNIWDTKCVRLCTMLTGLSHRTIADLTFLLLAVRSTGIHICLRTRLQRFALRWAGKTNLVDGGWGREQVELPPVRPCHVCFR